MNRTASWAYYAYQYCEIPRQWFDINIKGSIAFYHSNLEFTKNAAYMYLFTKLHFSENEYIKR